MKLDRDMQRKVLETCAAIYPQQIDPMELLTACDVEDCDPFMANVAYLAEHGLVDSKLRRVINGPLPWASARSQPAAWTSWPTTAD